jgi:RNA recognition motif-containing protein
LKGEVNPDDLKYEFKKFGAIKEYSYKGRYAFIEYEDAAAASKAIKEMDDQRINRVRITVEAASK